MVFQDRKKKIRLNVWKVVGKSDGKALILLAMEEIDKACNGERDRRVSISKYLQLTH